MMIKCRINAAFNFPAMALLYAGVGPSTPSSSDSSDSSSVGSDDKSSDFSFTSAVGCQLLASLSTLCKDPRPEVRRRVAAGFHEIVLRLKDADAAEAGGRRRRSASSPPNRTSGFPPGENKGSLFDSLTYLLFDESLSVLRGLVKHLDETLSVLAKCHLEGGGGGSCGSEDDEDIDNDGDDHDDEDHDDEDIADDGRMELRQMLFAGLVQCEETVYNSFDWRLQATVIEKWALVLPQWFSSDQVFFNVVPFMFDKIKDSRPLPGA